MGIACAAADGDMYVSSYRSHSVLRFSPSGRLIGVAVGASGDGGSRRTAFGDRRRVYSPTGLAFDPHDGTLHVLSYVTGSIGRFNGSGSVATPTYWRVVD